MVLTADKGDYASVLAEARAKVSLAPLGISDISIRLAVSSGRVLEIRGQEGSARASALAEKLREIFVGRQDVRVSWPVKTAEMRVTGLDDSVTQSEVAEAVAAIGGCQVGDVRVGVIHASLPGTGAIWIRCPADAARKIGAADRTVGRNAWKPVIGTKN